MAKENKSQLARYLGVSRQLLYYQHKQKIKDWGLKIKIEEVLHDHPSYGHRRLAIHLRVNRKRIRRVMKIFGIKPYRRRSKKFKYNRTIKDNNWPNLLLTYAPAYPCHVWASDFTYLSFKGLWIYLATIIDLFSREIVGFSVLTNHSNQLITNALLSAIHKHRLPKIIHSDQGSEYASNDYANICSNLNIKQSMSRPGCPWENGYQESFYSQFKVDLGDTNRFNSLGELVYEIYRAIYQYNNNRIHTKLKMPPIVYGRQYQLVEFVSNKRGT
jgi:transposase InsO family protein